MPKKQDKLTNTEINFQFKLLWAEADVLRNEIRRIKDKVAADSIRIFDLENKVATLKADKAIDNLKQKFPSDPTPKSFQDHLGQTWEHYTPETKETKPDMSNPDYSKGYADGVEACRRALKFI